MWITFPCASSQRITSEIGHSCIQKRCRPGRGNTKSIPWSLGSRGRFCKPCCRDLSSWTTSTSNVRPDGVRTRPRRRRAGGCCLEPAVPVVDGSPADGGEGDGTEADGAEEPEPEV